MISIVITLYNKESTIRRAIDSAINQKYKDIEIIVVNDCSTDNSLDICKEYVDKITIITTDKNSGRPYFTRQIGLIQAKGDFITFIDADDYLNNNALSECVELQKSTLADIIQMNIIRRITSFNIPISFKSAYDSSRALDACLYNEHLFPIQCWGKLYKTDLLRSVKPISYNGFWGEDRIFNLQILSSNPRIEYAQSAIYNYSWGGASTASFNIDALQDYKQIYQIKSDWAKKYGYECHMQSMQNELIDLLKYHIRHLISFGSMSHDSAIDYLQNEINQPFWRCFQLPPAEKLYKIEKKSILRISKKIISDLVS